MNREFEHNGCRLVYSIRGEGPPILLIQGVGVHGDGWLPQVDALTSKYRCLTFDNRGMGRSQPAPASLTVEQMAEDCRALMKAEGWDSAHVVGHSLGGLIAQALALSSPQQVRSLALLCTFANGRSAAPLRWRMIWLGLRTKVGTRRMRRRAFLRLVMSPEACRQADLDGLAEKLIPLFGHDLADQPAIVGQQLSAMRKYDATPRLGEINVPTLVVSGAHDLIAPPSVGRVIADGIKGSEFVELSKEAHGAPIISADEINRLLLAHLERGSAR